MTINTCAKRGKGKRIVDIGIKDFYDFYSTKELKKNREPKDYKLYSSIIKDANQMIQDSIVINNEPVRLPYKLGTLGVLKYKVNFNPDRKSFWRVDYKRSKEETEKRGEKIIIYYDQEFRYRWKWYKWDVKLSGKRWYTFYPCRPASRAIPKALRENKRLDYCEKLGI